MQNILYPEEFYSTLTQKGQVTIPISIRKLLGVNPKDKISFVVDQGGVKVKKGKSVTERTAGIFKSSQPALSPREEEEAAEKAWAEATLERMGK